jgi:hypothetical protein
MDIGFLFWLIMVLWIIFYGIGNWGPATAQTYYARGGSLPLFILLFLLGWRVFGFILRG